MSAAEARSSELGGLRAVAAFEFSKGVLSMLVAFGLMSLARSSRDISEIVQNLLLHLHIAPEAHLGKLLLKGASRLDGVNLFVVAMAVVGYGCLRFIESYGLWRGRVWAEWFALLSGVVFLPLEIQRAIEKPGALSWTVLGINSVIVVYMAYLRFWRRSEKEEAGRMIRPREISRARQ
jgi:uncharacterized membrane protein (DUF2068 family)